MAQPEKTSFTFPDESDEDTKPGVAAAAAPEVEVIDDTPEEDRGRKPMETPPGDPTQEELAGYSEGVRKRIQHFTKGYHDERRAKEAATREKDEAIRFAQAAAQENRNLRGSLGQNQTALVEQAKLAVGAEAEAARRKYKAAAEAFDTEAQLAAQEELTAARIKMDRLDNFRPAPVQAEQPVVQTQQQPQRAPAPDPKLAEWTEKNTWFGANKRMTAYALGLHEDLVGEGIQTGSKAYYDRIDADMKGRFPDVLGAGTDADAHTQRTTTNVVAPATRSTASRKVVLTQTQVNIAKRLGVPLEAYARQVAEMNRS